MCRILAITNFDYKLHKPLVDIFFELSSCGKVPENNTPGHLDGWGVGYYSNGKARVIKSGGSIRKEKARFYGAVKRIGKTPVLILHLRKSAWKHTNGKENSHPFIAKNIIFCHNGTILDYKKLKLKHRLSNPGALDSEIYFHYFMDFAVTGVEKGFRECVKTIKTNNAYTSLTCVFSDGKKLYSYRDFTKRAGYYTLYESKQAGSSFISSEPLGSPKWKLLKKGKLKTIKP
jgi:glutamine amidotransferase